MDLHERDLKHVWHPYTQHRTDHDPLLVASAHDATLVLDDGRELLDATSSWWTSLHGHGVVELVEAMRSQAETLDHVIFAGATHEPAVKLAEELVEVTPRRLSRAFFSNDGSTAVEVALKMAYHAWVKRGETQRTIFVALEGGYHGDTFGAMSVGDPHPFFEPYGPLLFEVVRVPPHEGALYACLEDIDKRVAGVIVEPLVQGAAGMRMYDPSFLSTARRLCDRFRVPLIADEVMTGFGRTGTLFACEQAGVEPDLMCVAKGLTGGMLPLAATLASEHIYEAFLSEGRGGFFPHGHSMTASPIGCAVALASLELVKTNDVPAKLDAVGRRLEQGLMPLKDDPRVTDLRRWGGIVAFDLVPPAGDEAGYMSGLQPTLRKAAIERGVLLRPLGNVLYAMPPACTTDDECDRITACMRELVDVVTP